MSLALPLVVFYAVASSNRHSVADGISFPLYFMTGIAAYGAMFAVVGRGAGIAIERSKGWIRQIGVTPLRAQTGLVPFALMGLIMGHLLTADALVPAEGWIVVAVWSVVLVPLSVLAYRRDTGRV